MQGVINVFMIGAQKAGTTSLYDWLGQHPDVSAPSEMKDYHFFTIDSLYRKGFSHLDSMYDANVQVRLHCAVNYLYFSKCAPLRIAQYNSDPKFIVCLRNPVDRAISAYKYFVRTHRESKKFSEALNHEIAGGLYTYEERADNSYLSHGYYDEQIEDYLSVFPNSRFHYVLFDDIADPDKQKNVMRGICEFLGIDGNYEFSFQHLNASGVPKYRFVSYLLRKSAFIKIFRSFIPLRLRKRIARRVEEMNISSVPIEVTIEDADIAMLKDAYRPRSTRLSGIVGDLPESWSK